MERLERGYKKRNHPPDSPTRKKRTLEKEGRWRRRTTFLSHRKKEKRKTVTHAFFFISAVKRREEESSPERFLLLLLRKKKKRKGSTRAANVPSERPVSKGRNRHFYLYTLAGGKGKKEGLGVNFRIDLEERGSSRGECPSYYPRKRAEAVKGKNRAHLLSTRGRGGLHLIEGPVGRRAGSFSSFWGEGGKREERHAEFDSLEKPGGEGQGKKGEVLFDL